MARTKVTKSKVVKLDYVPMDKQKLLHTSPATEILFGGAAGPGKSHALRWELLRYCLEIPGLQAYLFRRTQPELFHNHVLKSLNEFPVELGEFRSKENRWSFINGSSLFFCHCQYEKDVHNYQGAEIHVLGIDELTTFTEFQYDFLRTRVRLGTFTGIPKELGFKFPFCVSSSNPGGEGHAWVKRRFVDYGKPNELIQAPKKEGGMLRQYIPARLEDNTMMMLIDPDYQYRLEAMPEPWRTALREGNWDIFLGQAFNFSHTRHVIPKPIPVPEYAPLYMTYDYGFGAPFSAGWWWVDHEDRLYRFGEWYGWNGEPNKGLRMADSEVAEGILKKERSLGIEGKRITRIGGPDCFNKKPNPMGGGQGASTAEEFLKKGIELLPGDAHRVLKLRQFHQRLSIPEDDSMPMMMVYPNCEHFIRTIPLIQSHPNSLEDIDDSPGVEDHIYDEACHIMMYRTIGLDKIAAKEDVLRRQKEAERAKLEENDQRVWKINDEMWNDIREEEEEWNESFMEIFE